jgi:flagellar biosynthesis/type III secretory pathway M-ring protein FliF/YscJ
MVEQETTAIESDVMELPAEEVKVLDQETTTLEQEGTLDQPNVGMLE